MYSITTKIIEQDTFIRFCIKQFYHYLSSNRSRFNTSFWSLKQYLCHAYSLRSLLRNALLQPFYIILIEFVTYVTLSLFM